MYFTYMITFLWLLLLAFTSCNNNHKVFFVAAQKVTCVEQATQKCLQIREQEDKDWKSYSGKIQNFTYQEGFTYKVQVKASNSSEQDISKTDYTLVKVLSKEPAEKKLSHQTIASIRYEASTRGSLLKINLTPQQLTYSKMQGGAAPYIQQITKKEWETVLAKAEQVDLPTIQNLQAPSNKRFSDGALAAKIIISTPEGIFTSSTFDHGNPPSSLAPLVKYILSITENMD